MKKTLILVDGHALAFRSFFALERTGMKTTDKQPTWAVYGFFKALFDILKNPDIKPDAIAVAFDVGRQTFRLETYPEYKANRVSMPDTLHSQIGLIIEGLEAFNIPIYTKEGFEADDVIGTITDKAAKLGHKTLILTGDQDAFQLIDEEGLIRVLIPSKGELIEYDCEKVYEKLHIYPNQVVDYKALRGDTSDNIPGIRGIGEKSAEKLLNTYCTLDDIYKHVDEIKENALRTKLIEGKDAAYLSQFLATIKTDVDIDFDFEHTSLEIKDLSTVNAFLRKVQFHNFLRNIESILKPFSTHTAPATPQAATSQSVSVMPAGAPQQLGFFDINPNTIVDADCGNKPIDIAHVIVDTQDKFNEFLKQLDSHKLFSMEIEVTSEDFLYTDIVGMSFAFNPQIAVNSDATRIVIDKNTKSEMFCYYIPLFHQTGEQLDMTVVLEKLKPYFENKKIAKTISNAKNEINYLRKYDITLENVIFDVTLASYIKDPARNHDLNVQSLEHLEFLIQDPENMLGRGKDQKTFSELSIEQTSCYACDNASVSLQLTKFWDENLEDDEKNILYNIEVPLTYVLADMEYIGVSIDVDYLGGLSKEICASLDEVEKQIYKDAGEEFNINSPKKVGEILFDKLQLKTKSRKKTKTGYSTNAKVLEELAEEYDIGKNLLQQRHLTKLKTTYVDTLPELISPIDERIHTTYNQTTTLTGRLSSSNPNLQNIPIRTKLGNRIRGAFVPKNKETSVILSADYSQIELRLLAHVSGDANLIEAFKSDEDVHTITAAKVFDVPLFEVTKEMRSKAKAVNFGIIYGQTRYGLSKSINITPAEAQLFIDKYFQTYPKVKAYMEATKAFAYDHGFVETMYGRKRYLRDELFSSNFQIKEFAERAAINQPLQGAAADLIKIAMINLHKKLEEGNFKSKIILQVHDELVLEVEKSELDKISKLVKIEMELNQPLEVPLKVDVEISNSWMEGDAN